MKTVNALFISGLFIGGISAIVAAHNVQKEAINSTQGLGNGESACIYSANRQNTLVNPEQDAGKHYDIALAFAIMELAGCASNVSRDSINSAGVQPIGIAPSQIDAQGVQPTRHE